MCTITITRCTITLATSSAIRWWTIGDISFNARWDPVLVSDKKIAAG